MTYGYPGNVRELKNMIERAVLMAQNDLVKVSDLGIQDNSDPARGIIY